MRLAILAARDERAQMRMMAAAQVLAQRFGLDAQAADLTVPKRDAQAAAVLQREKMAELLEQVVAVTEVKAKAEVKAEVKAKAKTED